MTATRGPELGKNLVSCSDIHFTYQKTITLPNIAQKYQNGTKKGYKKTIFLKIYMVQWPVVAILGTQCYIRCRRG